MTKTQKEKWLERLFGIVSAIVVSIAIYSFTSSHDDSKQLINKVNQLDKEKAGIEYVDKKCLEIKGEIETDQTEIKANLRDLNKKTDKILELMITQKK